MQDAAGLLVGDDADLNADAMATSLAHTPLNFESLRRGGHTRNSGLEQNQNKNPKKGQLSFPVLQSGADPYSGNLNCFLQ